MRSTRFLATLFATATLAAPHAQTPPPHFEVASIKRSSGDLNFSGFGVHPGGRFTVTNASVREMIEVVYQLRRFQVEGLPDWVDSSRYDITAKAEGELPQLPPSLPAAEPPPAFLMMQSLLADRFTMTAHIETRQAPVYALTMARNDRRFGPNLQASSVDCAALRAARAAAGATRGPGLPPPPPPPPAPPAPGQRIERPACGTRGGPGFMIAGSVPVAALANNVSRIVNRPVIDRTALTGNFDFMVEFTPDQSPFAPGAPEPQQRPNADAPSIFTALQEQLGMKLESDRGPVEFLVVDHIERPTEN